MKNVMSLKKKFIEECKKKLQSKRMSQKDISKNTGLSDSTIKDFFDNKSDTKLSNVIKILNSLNAELKVK